MSHGCGGPTTAVLTEQTPALSDVYAARTTRAVTSRATVVLGEEALEPGHPVEKWYRDAKIYDLFEGTGQIQRRIIAKHLTGQNPT